MTQVPTYDGRVFGPEPVLSWSAIIAGALVALATSVFFTVLAAGFGYDVAAGGLATRQSLTDFTPELGAGSVAIQVVSSALGGYLAGRLRHAWPSAHLDEAHFRDTAQGLIAWALATVAVMTLAATVIGPAAAELTAATTAPEAAAAAAPVDPIRAAHVLAQSAFFTAVGMVLSAFIASVAARLGGLRTEHMLARP